MLLTHSARGYDDGACYTDVASQSSSGRAWGERVGQHAGVSVSLLPAGLQDVDMVLDSGVVGEGLYKEHRGLHHGGRAFHSQW